MSFLGYRNKSSILRKLAKFTLLMIALLMIVATLAITFPPEAHAGWEDEWQPPPPSFVAKDDLVFYMMAVENTVLICAVHSVSTGEHGETIGDCSDINLLMAGKPEEAGDPEKFPLEIVRVPINISVIPDAMNRSELDSLCALHPELTSEGQHVGICVPFQSVFQMKMITGHDTIDEDIPWQVRKITVPGTCFYEAWPNDAWCNI